MISPPIVQIPSYRQADFVRGLRQLTRSDNVEVRAFEVERVETAWETGSDRNAQSQIWEVPPCDSLQSTRDAHHIDNAQVTYLLPVHGLQGESPSVDYGDAHFSLGEAIDTQCDRGRFDSHFAYLVYDDAKITKAPDAWIEYWLPKMPREALLGILVARSAWAPRFGQLTGK